MSKFSYKEALNFGWEKTKSNFLFFLSILLILFVFSFISGEVTSYFGDKKMYLLFAVFSLALWVIQLLLNLGVLKISLNFVDNVKSRISDLFTVYPYILKYIIASLVYALIVIGGFILLIVPGIIWSIKYMFYGFLIIDKKMSPMEAIKKSGEITQGAKGNLLLFSILVALINFIGALLLLVGLLITVPMTALATAYVYRQLLKSAEEKVLETPAAL